MFWLRFKIKWEKLCWKQVFESYEVEPEILKASLCVVMCKAEHVNKELDDPAKEISRQPVEGTIWLPLALYKMQER